MTEDIHRRLAAVVACDVAGYSRLIRKDEEEILRTMRMFRREVFDPLIERYEGRLANTAGDSLLIEFASAVEAVRFAVAVQQNLTDRNVDQPPDRQIRFRIGINVGDVVAEGTDLLGDGVNLAARLEGLAEPGGILISRSTRDQIRDQLDLTLKDLGPVEVRNIDRPVHVFEVVTGHSSGFRSPAPFYRRHRVLVVLALVVTVGLSGLGLWIWKNQADFEPADSARLAYQLPSVPSIAVLPFRNLSPDQAQDFLAVSFSEDIVTSLAKLSDMFVISSSTTSKLQGEDLFPSKVAEDLGVRFVLTGSLQPFEDSVRVSVQLVDAIKGRYIWSERFDRDMTDLLSVKDEITLDIVANVGAELQLGERDKLRRRETDSLDAWLLQREGYRLVQNLNAEDNNIGRRMLERAIEIDPQFATAYANLAFSYRLDFQLGWVEDRQAANRKAFDLFSRALEIDPTHGPAMASLASWYMVQGDVETAMQIAGEAVLLEPSDYFVHAILGWTLIHNDNLPKAIEELELSLRLSPFGPDWVMYKISEAHLVAGDPQSAADAAENLLARPPSSLQNQNLAHLMYALALEALGEEDGARDQVVLAQKAFSKRTAEAWGKQRPYADPDVQAEWTAILHRLGMR